MVIHSNLQLAYAVKLYVSVSLYFSLTVLVVMEQICSIRAVIKGRGPEIFSCYYKHDLRLLS